jgi:hypothetical protein
MFYFYRFDMNNLPPPSEIARNCDQTNSLLPNKKNSCFIDCIVELLTRVVLPKIKPLKNNNCHGINLLFEKIHQYSSKHQFAQALELARTFVWKTRFIEGQMGDCLDVLHLFFDNSTSSPHYASDHILQPYLCVQYHDSISSAYLGPYNTLLKKPIDNVNFGQYVMESVSEYANKSTDKCTFPEFLFLSNPYQHHGNVNYPESFLLNGDNYELHARIYHDNLHFWCHFLGSSGEVMEVDNLHSDVKVMDKSLTEFVENSYLVLYIKSKTVDPVATEAASHEKSVKVNPPLLIRIPLQKRNNQTTIRIKRSINH